jgi:predicted anti-sigma-YlaC factor YlaD
MLAIMSLMLSGVTCLIGLSRGYVWPPPHDIPLLAFPEAILCVVAVTLSALALNRSWPPIRINGVLPIFSIFVAVSATFLFSSLRLNYRQFTSSRSHRLRADLEAIVRQQQRQTDPSP